MTKKRLAVLGGVVLIVMLIASLIGAAYVFADEPTPTPTPKTYRWGWGFCFGRGLCGQVGLEAAAKALGMTAEELSTQLWGGRTLADLAEKAGVDLQDVRDAVEAACQTAMENAVREAIEQALEKGYITQEQADWLLEGLEKGFFPLGRGFGFGRGMKGGFGFWGMKGGFRRGMGGGFGGFAPFSAPSAPSTAPSSSSL